MIPIPNVINPKPLWKGCWAWSIYSVMGLNVT